MRRRVYLWLAGVALVALALLLTDRLLWQPGLTEDNVRRIRPGMTVAEVAARANAPLSYESQGIYVVETPIFGGCVAGSQYFQSG